MKGLVYFVGAGPGDPELLTVKGLHIMRQADVLICDRFINPQLLKYAPSEAEIFYVGKPSSKHTLSQDEIHCFMAQKAKEGKKVVRLINGDPFLFGKGGEETESLQLEQIPFEIIPGIPTALAAPAYAGIPVTHRAVSSSFAVITDIKMRDMDWGRLAKNIDTFIFFVEAKNLSLIIEQLLQNGHDPSTPVAVIQNGTTIDQNVVIGDLVTIDQKVNEASLASPAIIIVGHVVWWHKKLRWFENKPLFGQRILITRAREQSKELSEKIAALGGEPLELPVIRMVPPQNQELDQALQRLDQYDWVLFTSVNGVKFFLNRMKEQKIDIRKLANAKIAVVGPKTKETVEAYGLIVDCMPKEHVAEAMVETMRSEISAGEKILFPRSKIARNLIPMELEKMGCQVDTVDAYDTVLADEHAEEIVKKLQEGLIHVVTFTSPSAVQNFQQLVAKVTNSWRDLMMNVKIVCIGPITANTAQKLGLTVDAVANMYTVDGLIEALLS